MNNVLQLLTEQGHDGFAEGLRLLVNEAMRLERAHILQAEPYERTEARQVHANGFKPKTVATRMAPITFSIGSSRFIVGSIQAENHPAEFPWDGTENSSNPAPPHPNAPKLTVGQ